MRASLDTNVLIHLYRAGKQNILFELFSDGLILYEQLRNVELENHGKELLPLIDSDIEAGKIELYTNEKLKTLGVYKLFVNYVNENRMLYSPGDLGEVYAISLAQTIGAYSLVTDDIKQGGPYMSLLQLTYDVMPFNFADVLILRYLCGQSGVYQTIEDFEAINKASELGWSFKSKIMRFMKRFVTDPYNKQDEQWLSEWVGANQADVVEKIKELGKVLLK